MDFLKNLSTLNKYIENLNFDKSMFIKLENISNWKSIKKEIDARLNNKQGDILGDIFTGIVLVILSNDLKAFYSQLKDYFKNILIKYRFVLSTNIKDICLSETYNNIIEQINIILNGINYRLGLEGDFGKTKNYCILGLEELRINDNIYYCMASADKDENNTIGKIQTKFVECKDTQDSIEKAITQLIQAVFVYSIIKMPDYIILYRKNRGINFIDKNYEEWNIILDSLRTVGNGVNNPKFVYLICDFNPNMKFLEKYYFNIDCIKNGTYVDFGETAKGKYEFCIQSCTSPKEYTKIFTHYEVIYDDNKSDKSEITEELLFLKELSFSSCFFNLTFKQVTPFPGIINAAIKGMDSYSLYLNYNLQREDNGIDFPIYT